MAYDSLRPYLQVLEQQGMMRWIDAEVDKDWEIASIVRMIFRAMPEEARYGIGFRNIKGFPGGRIVAGVVAASKKMIATAIGSDPTPESIHDRVMAGIANPIPPVIVKTGPCKEVIIGPDKVDLTKLPIPIWTPGKDAGPYLTPLWVTKDPDTGRRNVGIRRCQIKNKDTTGILFGAPDRGGAIHHAKWKMLGKPMPAALFIGADPVQYVVAPSRYGEDEFAVVGGIRGEAVELVKCETCDIEVPATAEFVIEGEILTDHVEPEGPFGEFTGYMAGGRDGPVFKVKCITHRKDPVMLGVISQFPPSESSMLKVALLESNLLNHLTKVLNIPGIADVHALEAGGCTATLWVSVKKIYAGQIDQLALGVWGYMGMSYFKWIVVTDDDIDIRDPFMRDWVMAWRVRPDKDMRILTDTAAVELDPASLLPDIASEDIRGGKALIDATKKWAYPDVSLPPLGQLRKVAAGWSKYGLPALGELKLPKAGE
jgi:UbiD family decarboxylase